jgi:hypothetical protein
MQTPPNIRRIQLARAVTSLAVAVAVALLDPEMDAYADEEPKESPPIAERPKASPHLRQLAEYGLDGSADSLRGYLEGLHPSVEQFATINQLIEQLGYEDYRVREAAMRALLRKPAGATEPLRAAIAGDNPEIRWRARHVLKHIERESRSLLHAVLLTIAQQRSVGLMEPLFGASEFCTEGYLEVALHRAVEANATEADIPFLRSMARSPEPNKRIAAVLGLAAVPGHDATLDAQTMLADSSKAVRAVAARVLAAQGDRRSLAVLVDLLEADELSVRLDAFRTLKAVTGEHQGYTVYDEAAKRGKAVESWRKWLNEHGATATLKLPLSDLPVDHGRLLVCDHGQSKLVEFDTAGNEVWQRQVPAQPWACVGLANGNRLVGSYNERSIVEYDRDGVEVWKVDGLPGGPTGIERLPNGNTLVACTEGSQVVEIDRDKSIVWRVQLEGRPVDAHRLDDGRTLVALQNAQKVIEVDPSGKTVWEIAGVGMAFSVQRLTDGNTLVCSLNQADIHEYDPNGKVAWSQGGFTNPYSAQRLVDGNTVVVDRTGIIEIDPKGTVVRRIDRPNISRAWRY